MNVLQKIQDAARRRMHSHAMYNHLMEIGKSLGKKNEPIPLESVKNILTSCNINDLDYVLGGLFRGHHEGLKEWRKVILKVEREARLKIDKKFQDNELKISI